jgi:hypothetical protein
MASLDGNFPPVSGGDSFGLDGFLNQSNLSSINLSEQGGVMDIISGSLSFLGPAGAIGGMLLGPLEGLAGEVFGKRNTADHFSKGGLDMLSKLYEGVAAQYTNDPIMYVNELSKGLYFLKKCYELFLGNSSHENTKKGHSANVQNCKNAINDLESTLSQVFKDVIVDKVIKTESMSVERYSGKKMFKGAKTVSYPFYTIVEKPLLSSFSDETISLDSSGKKVVSSSLNLGKIFGFVVAPFVIVGGLVYLIFKKKK